MNLKRISLLVMLALAHLPVTALAADVDTFSCGTIHPFWWRYDGPRTQLSVQCVEVEPVGDSFRIAFLIENRSSEGFKGGVDFSLAHAAVDRAGYEDPASPMPPSRPYSLLGMQAVERGTLPALRPGEHVVLQGYVQGFGRDANHIVTVRFHDKGQLAIDPQSQPGYWLRILSPRDLPEGLELFAAKVERVGSTLNGYEVHRVHVALRNVSGSILAAGTPITLSHGSSGSAGGYWRPDDVVDPNDPGNVYASFFREVLFQGSLLQPLYPGEVLEVEGMAHVPGSFISIQQLTVAVDE